MKMLTRAAYETLLFVSLAMAHDNDGSTDIDTTMNMDMHASSIIATPTAPVSRNGQDPGPTSYFSYGGYSSPILAHIVLMIIGWCFILPSAVLLSTGRSRLALPLHFLFLVINALGLLFGIVYNSQTPDLYEYNAHHKIGWIVSCVMTAQVVLALIFVYNCRGESKQSQWRSFNGFAFLPVATDGQQYHSSGESSQGVESSSSIRSPSRSDSESQAEYDGFENPEKLHSLCHWLSISVVDRFLIKRMSGIASDSVLRFSNNLYDVVDRIILPFGFIAIVTGAVTYGGIFKGDEIFNGLAHFIKGGIFFWYGILTLGRFIGAWADLGWAWNKKPPASVVGWKAKVPSGEFVESFVIWLYGVVNHVSISIMFFGGGLVGMLFESHRIRDMLGNTLLRLRPLSCESYDESWQPPNSQSISLNPMPALIIMLLGTMMGSHHQDSMTSTMVHKQWGNMLMGFAIARGMTYVLLFLRPSTSYLPARPPTEIVASFCLISGGLIFMLSARQVIEAMEFYELDAMFTFTVGMGFTAFIMSLVVLNIAIKAWALKHEGEENRQLS
ncbi:hypothetical protein N7481_000762 [Penicillium waksmanii]|uniref:uncharacterized protein n=1 Tax=Penicillium waksmanii TaxID=69791 RepID=UPI002549A6B2|nr:uncharacterized protein N7481_000762 [Penicillium waksmanii]KAJ6000353.1 hypothetical protein N7481_000762 [Penicillium waksmanii]